MVNNKKGNDAYTTTSVKFNLNSTCELIPDKMIIGIQNPQSRTSGQSINPTEKMSS